MVDLGIFESTKSLAWSNALSYNISKAFYDNMKVAQHWRMHESLEDAYLFPNMGQPGKPAP